MAAGEKSVLTDSPTWIIDPIDGTTNFVHRCVRGACAPSRLWEHRAREPRGVCAGDVGAARSPGPCVPLGWTRIEA